MIEILSQFYFPLLTAIAVYFFLLSIVNHYELRSFSSSVDVSDGPLVSVLIPVRNEELNIERCIKSLQNQQYKNFEILILNDNSTDDTLNILYRLSAEDSRVKVINGEALPPDWYGKPFAMHQLTKQAQGDLLLFTDADTIHQPSSISWAVTNLQGYKVDFISGYIGQVFGSFGEVITVPLMFCLTGFIIPLSVNRYAKKLHYFSMAIGQFIFIKRNVLDDIGGCETFKKKTSEDLFLSRLVKRKGYKTRFLNICDHVKCRMYNGFMSAIEGIGKNIFDFLGKRTFLFFLMMIGVFFVLILPFPLLFFCIVKSSPWILNIAIVASLYTLTWIFMFIKMKINRLYGFLWPLLFLSFIYMGGWAWYRIVSKKGFLWKDRKVN